MKKTFFIDIFLLCLSIGSIPRIAYSQTYNVKGNISTFKEPVRNAEITFISIDDTTKKYTSVTDGLGDYQLNIITSVKNPDNELPTKFELAQNYPNPFSNETIIMYRLNKPLDVSIKIYNILGQEVRTFRIGQQETGIHGVKWDGRNNFGEKVSQGIYLYRIQNGNETQIKKMIFTRGNSALTIPITSKLSSYSRELTKEKMNQFTLGTYTVRIANTNNTQPKILFTELLNIIVQHDTTINFQVKEAEQWKLLGLENERVTAIAIDPIDPKIIYAGTLYDFSAGINGKLFKSTNGGTTWDTLLIGGGYRSILIDPTNHNIIYALPGGIIKSENGGQTWSPILNGILLDPETRLQSLAMNPKNSNVLYAGTGGFFGGNLYKSYDGGEHWNKTPSNSLKDGVVSIAIDPIDTNNVYAGTAFGGILWKSTDAGATWARTAFGEIGTHDIFIDPQKPFTIYVGSPWKGIFKTKDGGINWENISQGLLSNSSVMKIQQNKSSRLFIIATYGDDGGIYEYSFQKNEWIKIGIDAVSGGYYYSDLKILPNSNNLYYGGKGMYVRVLKE